MTLTKERLKEMHDKLASLGNVIDMGPIPGMPGDLGQRFRMKLDVNLPQVLVGLGVAKDEDEAAQFMEQLISTALLITVLGVREPGDVLRSLINLGFFIGTVKGNVKDSN